MRFPALLFAVLILGSRGGSAQTMTNATAGPGAPPTAIEDELKKWVFSASVMGYVVPESRDYAQPTLTADRDWLHLETRYNYENLETGSAWLGYNFGGAGNLSWEFTPMLGAVFGDTTGIAPGFKGSISWWKLELFAEGEYLFDSSHSSGNFFYNWSELTIAPVEWFRIGMVTQRTRAYHTDRDIQRGFLVGLLFKKLSLTTYVFNPDERKPTIVLGAGVEF
jgi:hypothetical protein